MSSQHEHTLAACPFCGAKAEIDHSVNDVGIDTFGVQCTECTCTLGIDDGAGAGDWSRSHLFRSNEEALAAWNSRA